MSHIWYNKDKETTLSLLSLDNKKIRKWTNKMKKILLLLLILLCIVSVGCKKRIKCTINEFSPGYICSEIVEENKTVYVPIYEVVGMWGQYLFKEYNDLISFFDDNDLFFYSNSLAGRYNEEYFTDNALIIHLNYDPHSSIKYTFKFMIDDNKLLMEINKKW